MKQLFPVLLTLFTLLACKKQSSPGDEIPNPTPPQSPAITPVGQPTGTAISKTIGPAGGTITSADGKLTFTVPAGALDADQTISMQPIENHAPLGMNKFALRFTPHGLQFKKPAKLTLKYDEQDLIGSAPQSINLATQTEQRAWKTEGNATVNSNDRTITANINHFSDFAFYETYKLMDDKTKSDSAVVRVGVTEPVIMRVVYVDEVDGFLIPKAPADKWVREWSINGIVNPPITNRFGFIAGINGKGLATVEYVAPRQPPTPTSVTVTAKLNLGSKGELFLLRNFEIVDLNLMTINGRTFNDPVPSALFLNDGTFLSMGLVEILSPTKHASVSVEIKQGAPAQPGTYNFAASDKVRILATNGQGSTWSSEKVNMNGTISYSGHVEVTVTGTAPNRRVTAKIRGSLFGVDATEGNAAVDATLDVVAN